ncbi:MAG TPA: hypothetical protein ENI20_08465 [Bacteroides sp.]|nr:hypothetical protein [Bacteroides sp.]
MEKQDRKDLEKRLEVWRSAEIELMFKNYSGWIVLEDLKGMRIIEQNEVNNLIVGLMKRRDDRDRKRKQRKRQNIKT